MKALICAAALVLAALPAAAQYSSDTPSDRYTRERAEERREREQQAQTPDQRRSGEIETLRRDNMNSPNVKGEQVPEDTSTGAAAPEQRGQAKKTEGGIRP